MKHVVIAGHPQSDSFTMTIARGYCDAVRGLQHEVVLRDLYRMGFDPILKASELTDPHLRANDDDCAGERELISKANVVTFVYPMWFNGPPAIVKGYMDRVFSGDVGVYRNVMARGKPPKGRFLLTFSSSGAAADWLRQEGGLTALRNLFDEHFAAVCGLKLLDHIHFPGIRSGLPADMIEERVGEVRKVVARHF